jgi:hypothetical protein
MQVSFRKMHAPDRPALAPARPATAPSLPHATTPGQAVGLALARDQAAVLAGPPAVSRHHMTSR